ncbi:MAG TPA: MFS transporter [Thermoplasmata archaeon]|nr:MFS transporter [Thermoplasmata archaeon]
MKTQSIHLLYQSAASSSLIFIPLLAEGFGAQEWEIGVIGAVYGTALFASSYLFGRLSDIHNKRFIILLGLAASGLAFALQIFAGDVISLTVARGLAGFAIGIFPPALVAYVYEAKIRFGRFLSFGPLGMAIGAFFAGLIAIYYQIFIFSSLCLLLAFLIGLTLPAIRSKPMKIPRFPKHLIKRDFFVYLSLFFRHVSANAVWIIFPLFVKQLGGTLVGISLLYTVNYIGQFIFMNLFDRFKSSKLIICGFSGSALTFLCYAFTQNFYQFIPIELLLAFSWSSLWVGMNLHLLNRNVEHSTVIGLLTSTQSISIACGPFIGGWVAYFLGYRATMWFAFALSLLALLTFEIGIKREE